MKNKNFLLGLLAFFSSYTDAGTMGTPIVNPWTAVATLSAGPIWGNLGQAQNIYFSEELTRTYTINNTSHTLGMWEIFAGGQRFINPRYDGQIGILYAATSRVQLSGYIWDFADPRFENYFNTYKTKFSRVALKGKLIRKLQNRPLLPWISASIGPGFNKASSYTVYPLICEVIPLAAANFRNHTHKDLTWSVGIGIQRILSEHWQVGIGYEYTDWGKSQFDGAPAQPAGRDGLVIGDLRTNGLMFNLTWVM